MPLQVRSINIGADAIAADIVEVSLHSADPGDTGADELSSANYSRQPITWNPASGGVASNAEPVTFELSAGDAAMYSGLWSADGQWCGGSELSVQQEFSGDGQYNLNSVTIPGQAL